MTNTNNLRKLDADKEMQLNVFLYYAQKLTVWYFPT